ncbi:1-phosphofructokinase [Anaerocolumna sedimenticola]|uniref:Tagatose-6-phosphate kinase n=1 Tax=Anaerocolumna sedimenticola TaxID=2696063 RepID=A0A6P1TE08_9FIRM|nr:1-phosphofructokinase [Anaerocolumna sedimenticola]QHQ59470.1 1-phosphofructokinase [Anaerocolumna sedimenticola]
MIITVTMNPAIDKTVELEQLERGSLNRLKNVIMDVGGKGINVSKTIKELGGDSIATGFIGGSGGSLIEKALREQGIKFDFVEIKNEIRTNMKVLESNGFVTELNEPGPVVSEEELEQLTQKLISYANENTLFIMAGSIPNGVSKTVYHDLIQKVKAKGAKVFLDADGELFIHSLEASPDYIKPNRAELEEYFHMDYRADEKELVKMGKQLIEKGIRMAAISLGQMGALFLTADKVIKCPGLKVEAHSTVGAGDAMVAALAYGLDQGLDLAECSKLGLATSAGAVTTKGTKPPKRELVDELMKKVEVIEL